MRKTAVLFIILFASFCSIAVAEEQDSSQSEMQRPDRQMDQPRGERPEMEKQSPQEQRPDMMGPNKMGKMGGSIMGMHPTVVATSDGGVVVLAGGKLAKYDSSLNLVKEVEMKGGPKPADKRSDNMQMRKLPMPPKEEPASEAPEEPALKPTATGADVQQ